MKKPLIILTGPTAAGKTELSIRLAKEVNGSIISADSMQVYQYMDIGSAKIKEAEMGGIAHYLIDELKPWEEFDVTRFQALAKKYIEEIYARNQIPIIAGGTGFYIQALLYDIDFTEEAYDKDYRQKLERIAIDGGKTVLHQMLAGVDQKAADQIHENNVKRVIRALEFYHLSGKRISEHNERERAKNAAYNFAYFVLNDERKRLYERINQRVDDMMEAGLVNEVKQLREMGCTRDMTAMQGLGYKEILDYLEQKIPLEEAVYLIKRDTRHFAKRQLTWFRRERDVIWVNQQEFGYDRDQILAFMKQKLTEVPIIIQ